MDYLKLLGKKSVVDAPIWKRVFAFIIDLLIIDIFIFLPFKGYFEEIIPSTLSYKEAYNIILNSNVGGYITAISIVVAIFALLYFAILEYKIGQTVGKIMLNLYVVNDMEKEKLKAWQCLVRTMFFIPIFPFIILWVIDPIYLLFIGKTKRFSEVLSKTKVIERR